jgi:hypothetical protein
MPVDHAGDALAGRGLEAVDGCERDVPIVRAGDDRASQWMLADALEACRQAQQVPCLDA